MRDEGRSGGRDTDGLARYARAARQYPPLSREQEHAVALCARRGDARAAQTLVRHNLSLVMLVARRQQRGGLRLDDLVQEGNLGLLRAAEKFDPQAGTRFSTYAVWWIRAFVGRHLRAARSTVRPRSGRVALADLSLDAPGGDDDAPAVELLEEGGPGAEARFLSAERDRGVRQALPRLRRRLGELGWTILNDRLLRDAPLTLAEVGAARGVSRERVRQVEVRTLRYLRQALAPLALELGEGRPAAPAGLSEPTPVPLSAAAGWR